MTYRIINVNGKSYEYVIGRQIVKIKGVGHWYNSDVGSIVRPAKHKHVDQYVVTPQDVRNLILGKPSGGRSFIRCSHGVVTDKQVFNPYERECHDNLELMIDCSKCVEEVSEDI